MSLKALAHAILTLPPPHEDVARGICDATWRALVASPDLRDHATTMRTFLDGQLSGRRVGSYCTIDNLVDTVVNGFKPYNLRREGDYSTLCWADPGTPIRNTANHIREAWLRQVAETGELPPLPTDVEIITIYKSLEQ